jgi:hypothetical protein
MRKRALFFALLFFFPLGLAAQNVINPSGWLIDSSGRLIAIAAASAASPQVIKTGVLVDAQGRVVLSPSSGGIGGASITVNGGAALASPVNFQNGAAVNGFTVNFSNPSAANVQAALSGTLADAGLANAYSGVGACGAGQFVNTLTRDAAPTCATPGAVGAVLLAPTTDQTITGSHALNFGSGADLPSVNNAGTYGPPDATLNAGVQGYWGKPPIFITAGSSATQGYAVGIETSQDLATHNLDAALAVVGFGYGAASVGQNVTALELDTQINGSGNVANMTNLVIAPDFESTGILTNMFGINVANGSNGGGGAVTNHYGIAVQDQHGVGTNSYGLWIADQGTGANNYAINVEGGQSNFKGPVNANTTGGAAGVFNAATGFRIANAAPSGHVPRGNGTNYIDAQLGFGDLSGTASDAQLANAYSGVGSCTAGQFATALTRNAAPTCGTPGAAANTVVTNPSTTATNTIQGANSSTVALTVKQAASGTPDIFDVLVGTNVASNFDYTGARLKLGSSASGLNGSLSVHAGTIDDDATCCPTLKSSSNGANSYGGLYTLVQGADYTSAIGSVGASPTLIRGGNDTAGAAEGGTLQLAAGTNNTTTQPPGLVQLLLSKYKGTTVTKGNLVCLTSTFQTVTDCATGANAGILAGVALTTANPIQVIYSGEAVINTDNTSVVGDFVCMPPASTGTTGQGHDNGTTACSPGLGVGVVEAITSPTAYGFPIGGQITPSATAPVVLLRPSGNIPTLDAIGNPVANATFTFPSANNLTLNGTSPTGSLYTLNVTSNNSAHAALLHVGAQGATDSGGYWSAANGFGSLIGNFPMAGITGTAKGTNAAGIGFGFASASAISFYAQGGLTSGNTFTPTEVARINSGGLAIGSNTITSMLNVGASQQFQVSSTGVPAKVSNIATAGIGTPIIVGVASLSAQTAGIGTTTLLTTGSATAFYRVTFAANCDATAAAATVSVTVGWTDPSSTAQTNTSTAATCTSLGSGSMTNGLVQFRAKNATAITYSTAIANSPNYDVSVVVEQMTSN